MARLPTQQPVMVTLTGVWNLLELMTASHSSVSRLPSQVCAFADGPTENYVYMTSGRSPALSGTTLFHAVNNVWSSNSGHLIEGDTSGMGLYEGNVFVDSDTVVQSGFVGSLFNADSSNLSECSSVLGRDCVANTFSNSGSFDYSDTSFFSEFSGKTIVAATSADSIQSSVISAAGNTL